MRTIILTFAFFLLSAMLKTYAQADSTCEWCKVSLHSSWRDYHNNAGMEPGNSTKTQRKQNWRDEYIQCLEDCYKKNEFLVGCNLLSWNDWSNKNAPMAISNKEKKKLFSEYKRVNKSYCKLLKQKK